MKLGKWTAEIHFTNRLHVKIIPQLISKVGRMEWAFFIFVLCVTYPYNADEVIKKTEGE